MDDPDFTGTGRRQFRARLEPVKGIRIQHVPGSGTPASLLLALRDRPDLMEPLADVQRGAILVLEMRWEDMVDLHRKIGEYAQHMGLTLPE